MRRVEYKTFDGDIVSVRETKRQKDILDILDELLDNARYYSWEGVFADEYFILSMLTGQRAR